MQFINQLTNAQIMMGSIITVLLCIIGVMILLAKEEYEQAIEDQRLRDTFRELQKTSELTFPNGVTIPVTEKRLKDIWEGMNQPKGNLIDIFS